MSTFSRITRHPNTGKYELASWKGDYFGHHLYGVKFDSDPVVYPADMVNKTQLKTFWVDDVLEALSGDNFKYSNVVILDFLSELDKAYKARWKRDPAGGEGAVKWQQEMRGDDDR